MNFLNKKEYLEWRAQWRREYAELSQTIRHRKKVYCANSLMVINAIAQAREAMALRTEATERLKRLLGMRDQLRDQKARCPIEIDTRVADFNFNKISLSYPFMPKWQIRANGQTFYVNHLDAQMGFSTRELEEGPTLGMLRFRNAQLTIDKDGVATLREKAKLKAAA